MKFIEGEQRKIRVDPDMDDTLAPLTTRGVVDDIKDPTQLTHNLVNTKGRYQSRKFRWMRLSEIDRACAREWVIGHVRDIPRKESVAFPMLCQMDMGSALHHYLQNHQMYFGDNFYGYWRCSACGNLRRFGVRPKEPCEFCGSSPRATFYHEYMFRLGPNAPYHVVGKVDGIIRVSDKYRFIEIKTYWKPMNGPMGEHVAQLGSYMYFSQFDDSDMKLPIKIDRSVGYLMYFSKQFNYKSSVLTYPVKPTERLMKPYQEKAASFTKGVRQGDLPVVLRECEQSHWGKARPKACPVKKICQEFHESARTNIFKE